MPQSAVTLGKCRNLPEPQFSRLPRKDPVLSHTENDGNVQVDGRCSVGGGTAYLSCWRSPPADSHVLAVCDTPGGGPLPGTPTASGLKEQREGPSEGLSGALRAPGCGPSALPPPQQIHFHPMCTWHPSFPRRGGD